MFRRSAAALALSASLAALSATGAFALDAEAFGARLKDTLAEQGTVIEWRAIRADGDDVTIEAAAVKPVGEGEKLELGDITLQQVTETEGGAYRIGAVELPVYTFKEGTLEVQVEGFSVTGLTLPAEGATDPLASIMLYETADLAGTVAKVDGKEVFRLSNLHMEVTPPEQDAPLEFSGSVESFSGDLSQIKDVKAREAIAALGYSSISGNAEMAGSWSPADGRLTLSQYDLSVADAGTLGITADVSGYTPEFAKAVQELQAKMAENPEGNDSAQGMAMLGLMQQLNFHSATIRFTDDSLTDKVLDYVASQQGAQRSDVVNQTKGMLPFALAALNNPEFSASVTAAVSSFLDNPGSLVITAQPASPVPLAMIAASAMAAPQSLIQQLNVTVTANETP